MNKNVLIQITLMFTVWLAALAQCDTNTPTATELIDKLTEALDSTSSVIEDYQKTTIGSAKTPVGIIKGNYTTRGQYRYDGKGQIYDREYLWGKYVRNTNIPKDKPRYRCSVTNSQIFYQHNKNMDEDKPGIVSRTQNPGNLQINIARHFGPSYLAGYINSDQRLDFILRQAEKISVLAKTEKIDDSECFVIDADTAFGHYRIWLDLNHGFQPAQIQHNAKEGQRSFHHVIPKGGSAKTYLKNVRFEEIDNIWVPMEADVGSDLRAAVEFSKEDYHYKRTNIVLHPDHNKLGSFDDPLENPANDPELADGANVQLDRQQTRYTWQEGQLIPNGEKTPAAEKD